MINELNIGLIQTDLHWEHPAANLEHISQLMSVSAGVDLFVLPEMFTTGFTMKPSKVAQSMQGETVSWMLQQAKMLRTAITGSVVISENGSYFNRLLFVTPNGMIEYYDKRHLFTLAGEHDAYSAGSDRIIIDYKGFRICPLVCYDLRFPVFSRNTDDYDVLLYVANWPEQRIAAWDALLKARSIENMCYTVAVNRTGTDENGHAYVGHSQVVDPMGNYIVTPSNGKGIIISRINKAALIDARTKFPFLQDRDGFTMEGVNHRDQTLP